MASVKEWWIEEPFMFECSVKNSQGFCTAGGTPERRCGAQVSSQRARARCVDGRGGTCLAANCHPCGKKPRGLARRNAPINVKRRRAMQSHAPK